MTYLIAAADRHFAWLLGEAPPPDGLRGAAGGVEAPAILGLLRRLTAGLHAAGCFASWLIVCEGEVVGLCSFKQPPDGAGSAEIGYGIAESCRRRGYATEAVGLLLKEAGRDAAVTMLCAQTAVANIGSRRVLERNGFSEVGTRHDPGDGDLNLWARTTPAFLN